MHDSWVQKVNQAVQQVSQAPELYRHRLVLVVAPIQQSRTILLSNIAEQLDFEYINVNLELSRRLLEVPKAQQPLKAFTFLNNEIIQQSTQPGLVLDHLEILFDPRLKLDPMRCLLEIARRFTVVARWNGVFEKGYLVHAEPGHPEFVQFQAQDGIVVGVESTP